ncbi:MAG: AMP-binding protein [Parahaliea sp.]
MHPRTYALTNPDKPAFIMADSGETVSYGELEDNANRIAQLFRKSGLGNGDHIAIMLANEPLFFHVVWAAQRSGLVYTCISTHLNVDDAMYILANCEAKLLVTSSSYLQAMGDPRARAPALANVLLTDGARGAAMDLVSAMAEQPATAIADEQAGVDMLYSSGTTGRPKGVAVTLESTSIDEMLPVMKGMAALYGFDEHTVYLSTVPLYHAAPLRFNLLAMSQGGTCVIMRQFDGSVALDLIERFGVTHSQWVPIMFSRMLKAGLQQDRRRELSTHRVAIHAAAPCPVAVKQAMIDWWGPILYEYYSSTEGIGFTAIDSHQWLRHPGSVGQAVVGDIRILDEQGREQARGTSGLVYFANGPGFSYFGDPEKTAAARNSAGWYSVGDIG